MNRTDIFEIINMLIKAYGVVFIIFFNSENLTEDSFFPINQLVVSPWEVFCGASYEDEFALHENFLH